MLALLEALQPPLKCFVKPLDYCCEIEIHVKYMMIKAPSPTTICCQMMRNSIWTSLKWNRIRAKWNFQVACIRCFDVVMARMWLEYLTNYLFELWLELFVKCKFRVASSAIRTLLKMETCERLRFWEFWAFRHSFVLFNAWCWIWEFIRNSNIFIISNLFKWN